MLPKILIVDDHRMMREGLRRVIAENPAWTFVGEAADAEAAWGAIQLLIPDVVLVDLDIPGGGGIQLMRRIVPTYPKMKLLVLTGRPETHLVQQALDAGAAGYLLKTNGATELSAAITAVLGGKTYLCADTTTAMFKSASGKSTEGSAIRDLPPRELEVLRLVVEGLRNKEIAAELGIGVKSVETYRGRLMKRLNCSSPAELVRLAIRQGLAGP